MVLVIIIVRGIAVDEAELADVGRLVGQQLGGIEAVVLAAQHLGRAGHELVAAVDGDVDLGGHRLVALGVDEQHAGGTLGTVEGGTVLEHGDALDVVDVQVGQQVVVVAVVKHGAVVLHVGDDAVDDDQRLGVGLQAVEAGQQHDVTLGGVSAAAYAAHVGTEALADERVDALLGGVVEALGTAAQRGRGGLLVDGAEGGRVHTGVGGLAGDGLLQQLVAVDAHGETRGVVRHLDLVLSVLVGHGREAAVAVGLHVDTGQRLSRGGVGDGTGDGLIGSLCHRYRGSDEQ